jgi:YbbR domain-containing protein
MKKQIQITRMVRNVTIICPEASGSIPPSWEISIRTDFNKGSETKMEIFKASHYEVPNDIDKIEPGMYVNISYFAHNVRKHKEDGHVVIMAEDIYINREETEAKRNQFDYEILEDEEEDGVTYKRLIDTPHRVSG